MLRNWREYPADRSGKDGGDNSDIRDVSPPIVPNVTNVTGLPASVQAGLAYLSTAPAPRLIDPAPWPLVISDALMLAADGWAAKAMALGWTELDLFGAVSSRHGDPDADGLAVKLTGRTILALCETFATVTNGNGRASIYRGNNDGAKLLWMLGHRPNETTVGKGGSHD